MRIDLHLHIHSPGLLEALELLGIIKRNTETIMVKQSEAAARLSTIADQVTKVREEVQKLKDTAAADPDISPELAAQIDRVGAAVQGVDDLNEDAAPTPPTEG